MNKFYKRVVAVLSFDDVLLNTCVFTAPIAYLLHNILK